jgi:hypothetical protein
METNGYHGEEFEKRKIDKFLELTEAGLIPEEIIRGLIIFITRQEGIIHRKKRLTFADKQRLETFIWVKSSLQALSASSRAEDYRVALNHVIEILRESMPATTFSIESFRNALERNRVKTEANIDIESVKNEFRKEAEIDNQIAEEEFFDQAKERGIGN